MKKIFATIIIASALTSACENKDEINRCYYGRVIWSSCCTGSTFISLPSSFPIGKDTRINGQDYLNVIQVVGYMTGPDVYLNLRAYDPQKDASLITPHCYCLVAVGMDVPLFVATAVSTILCPDVTEVR